MMKYDVLFIDAFKGGVEFVDTFKDYKSAHYFAAYEQEWEYYTPDKSYVLAIQPHYSYMNLTPHEIRVIGAGPSGADVIIPTSGTVARCECKRAMTGSVNGIPVNRTVMGEVQGLPAPIEGVVYIVSKIVAEACADRDDVLIVDDTVRDESGRIIGCKAFAHV